MSCFCFRLWLYLKKIKHPSLTFLYQSLTSPPFIMFQFTSHCICLPLIPCFTKHDAKSYEIQHKNARRHVFVKRKLKKVLSSPQHSSFWNYTIVTYTLHVTKTRQKGQFYVCSFIYALSNPVSVNGIQVSLYLSTKIFAQEGENLSLSSKYTKKT